MKLLYLCIVILITGLSFAFSGCAKQGFLESTQPAKAKPILLSISRHNPKKFKRYEAECRNIKPTSEHNFFYENCLEVQHIHFDQTMYFKPVQMPPSKYNMW